MNALLLLERPRANRALRIRDASCIEPPKSTIAHTAMMHLRSSPYAELRRIQCEAQDGILFLEGRVSSFHLKQLAQEWVRSQKEVSTIRNNLGVNYPVRQD